MNISLVGCSTTHGPRERERERGRDDIIDFSLEWIWVQLDSSGTAVWYHSGLQPYTHTHWSWRCVSTSSRCSLYILTHTHTHILSKAHPIKQSVGTTNTALLPCRAVKCVRLCVWRKKREKAGGWRLENPWQQPLSMSYFIDFLSERKHDIVKDYKQPRCQKTHRLSLWSRSWHGKK